MEKKRRDSERIKCVQKCTHGGEKGQVRHAHKKCSLGEEQIEAQNIQNARRVRGKETTMHKCHATLCPSEMEFGEGHRQAQRATCPWPEEEEGVHGRLTESHSMLKVSYKAWVEEGWGGNGQDRELFLLSHSGENAT